MIAHALLGFYRNLTRHRLYTALNVLGLALGIATFLVLTLLVRYENGFNRWIPNADLIYRLDSAYHGSGYETQEYSDVTFVAYDLLKADYPQIEAATRDLDQDAAFVTGANVQAETLDFVDPNFLDVIRLKLLAGSRATALSSPDALLLSASMAMKYFGTTEALGRAIQVTVNGKRGAYTVSGVFANIPTDSSFKLTALAPISAQVKAQRAFVRWGSSSGEIYLKFRNKADAASVAADLPHFVARRASGAANDKMGLHPESYFSLLPVSLADAHYHDVNVEGTKPGADRRVIVSLGTVGVLALLVAAINTVNLSTARAGLRAREVALRKVMGATRASLMIQFLGEATALVAAAALIGLCLAEMAVPMVNALGGWNIRLAYGPVLLLLAAIVLVVGFGAGLYPAIVLAGYRPAAVLASARTPSGGRGGARVRSLLVLAQFASGIAFAICTLVVDAQASFLRNADRGFDNHGLIIIQSLADDDLLTRQTTILDRLRAVPGVVAVTASDREPNSNNTNNTFVTRPGLPKPDPHMVEETIGRDYARAYGIRLVAGRMFDDAHSQDDLAGQSGRARITNVIINQSGVSTLGFSDPTAALGQTFNSGNYRSGLVIIGVVSDIRFVSPREPVRPQYYVHDTHGFANAEAAVRFSGVPFNEMMQRLQTAWHSVVPDEPFVADSADGRMADFYRPDQQRARLFSIGSVLAMGIACVGLYGLAAFSTARRTREIGIRKVLGASGAQVLRLLVGQFLRPVLVACLVACPVAWLVMRGWLDGFDQRIALSPSYFALAVAGALVLSTLTVLGQAIRVARAEPARALRDE